MQDRKKHILKAIIESYIDTAEPVASNTLALTFDRSISSATIRNEMSELEEMGYLEKPHISAGRIPSYAAYRLYVNELMDRKRELSSEIEAIRVQLESKMSELSNIVYTASRVVSSLTNQTAVAAVKSSGVKVKRVELLPMDDGSYALVLLTAGEVKSRTLKTGGKIDRTTASMLTAAVNMAIADGRIELLLPSMERSVEQDSPLFRMAESIVRFIDEIEQEGDGARVHVEGAEKLLNMREYQNTAKARELMEYLSDGRKLMDTLSAAGDRPISIRIGPEIDEPRARDASFVFTSYDIDENTRGIIGIVAPTRMDYSRACAHLTAFRQAVRQLSSHKKDVGETDENR